MSWNSTTMKGAFRYLRALGRMKIVLREVDEHGTLIGTSTKTCSTPVGLLWLAKLRARIAWVNFRLWLRQNFDS